jgi:hypothetical protein
MSYEVGQDHLRYDGDVESSRAIAHCQQPSKPYTRVYVPRPPGTAPERERETGS